MASKVAKRILRISAVVVGAAVVLLVGLLLLLQTQAVSRRVQELVVPRVSAALGRPLTLDQARLRLFPKLGVALTHVAIAGRPGGPALVQIDTFEVHLALWPLVRSLGRDIEVSAFRLVRPTLTLVRASDGTWNHQALGGAAASPPPAAPPPASRAQIVVGHASIEEGVVRVIDAVSGPNAVVTLSHIDLSADHLGWGQPLDFEVSAAIAGAEKNFSAKLHAARLPASPAELGLAHAPELRGGLALHGLEMIHLRPFLPPRLTAVMTGGRLETRATLATRTGRYELEGAGALTSLKLRGEAAQGHLHWTASVDPSSGASQLTVTKLELRGPGLELGGQLSADLPARGATRPTVVRFALAGPLLDLGQVMGVLPTQPAPEPKKPVALTAEQRRAVKSLDVEGTLTLQRVVRGGFVLNDLRAKATLERGAFVLRQTTAGLFAGRIDASGSRVDLAPVQPTWTLFGRLTQVDLAAALKSLSGRAPVTGRMDGRVTLMGAGAEWATLQKQLTGQGEVTITQGSLTTTDLGGALQSAVARGLSKIGQGRAAQAAGTTGQTPLRDVAIQFTMKDGAVSLRRPIDFSAPFGAVHLGGRIGLDGTLALAGTSTLGRGTLQGLTASVGMSPPSDLTVPLDIGGTLSSPSVSVHPEQALARMIGDVAKQQANSLRGAVEDRAKREARRGLGDVLRGLSR